MIRLTIINDIIKMEIQMHLPQGDIISFLQMKGYEVKGFAIDYPESDGFLIYEPAGTYHTFTATKAGEEQSRENLYLDIFEREIKELLKEIA